MRTHTGTRHEFPVSAAVSGYSQNPHQALVQLWVHRLQIRELDGFPQKLLVEGNCEAPIYVVSVEHSQAHDPTHKVEIRQMVL